MTNNEFLEHRDEYDGLCLSCHGIKSGGTEPDAEGYHCEECGRGAVQGMENALLDGNIELVDDEEGDDHE